jgi:serine/threonine protein kinase
VYLAYKFLQDKQAAPIDEDLDRSKPFVCKLIDRKALSENAERNVEKEILNLEMIQSKGVINLIEKIKTNNTYYIFIEYCNGGDLSMLLKSREVPLSEEECRLIFTKLAHGLKDMHDSCVVHRDIKLSNIMINFNRSILLQDGSLINLEDLLHFN